MAETTGMSTDTARLAETAARAALGSYFNEDRGRTQSLGLSVTAAIAAAIRAARQAALNEAAQICEGRSQWAVDKITEDDIGQFATYSNACDDCEEIIRSLMAPKGEGG